MFSSCSLAISSFVSTFPSGFVTFSNIVTLLATEICPSPVLQFPSFSSPSIRLLISVQAVPPLSRSHTFSPNSLSNQGYFWNSISLQSYSSALSILFSPFSKDFVGWLPKKPHTSSSLAVPVPLRPLCSICDWFMFTHVRWTFEH